MLNKRPIFINGFSFGGTNMITNFLASHPDVCWLSGETHEIFYSKPRKKLDKWVRRLFYAPVQIMSVPHIFGRECEEKPNQLPTFMMRYVDLIFYTDKITTKLNKFKYDNVRYSRKEVRACRFLAKNVNGVVLASPLLSSIYPDATFFALVRNGLSLCEGYVRRGRTAEAVGRMYETVCQKMIHDSQNIPNYNIVRFEDMVSDPLSFMKKIYAFSDLNIKDISKVRLQAKRSMDKNGTRKYTFGGTKDRETHWCNIDDIEKFMRKDVNENQANQLSSRDRDSFMKQAKKSMEYLGYV